MRFATHPSALAVMQATARYSIRYGIISSSYYSFLKTGAIERHQGGGSSETLHYGLDEQKSGRVGAGGSGTVKADRTMTVVRAVYDEVHLALWAVLTAFVIYFAVFVAPKLPELQAAAERQRISRIAAQDDAYCAKWRMGPASAMHDECISDLQQLRAKIEDRIAEESDF